MKLYNTLGRQTEELVPLNGKKVKIYTCGLTVYNHPHIGNWVGYIYWDVLVRFLKYEGYDVDRVQNITDVGHLVSDADDGEDKMEKGARKEGITAWNVAEKYINIANDDAYNKLGLLQPDHLVRATDYIPQQIAFVEELEKKGCTYLIAGDGIYFDTTTFSNYAELAKIDVKGLRSGERIEDVGKNNPTDFAVWKLSKPDENRDMEWDSPWGKGFPGWHLECSVMARELLGDQIDIHTGGVDHIPIHHTNEIAQTESITGKKFSTFWVHNNHIKVDGTKMSKSLGNIYTLDDIVVKGFNPMAFKLMVLSKHYRTEGNFTWVILEASQNRLKHWQEAASLIWQGELLASTQPYYTDDDVKVGIKQFEYAIANDLDTPGALATVDAVINHIEKNYSLDSTNSLRQLFKLVEDILGISVLTDDVNASHRKLIKERADAREKGDWIKSDELRNTLEAENIVIKDTPYGQIWSWK